MEPSTDLLNERKWYVTTDFITDDDNIFFFRARALDEESERETTLSSKMSVMLEQGK
jgi:hypothetical protein